jgi:hypothetical protein
MMPANLLGMEATSRNSRCPAGLEAHTHSLKHLEGSIKLLQEAQGRGYGNGYQDSLLDVLRGLENFRVHAALTNEVNPLSNKKAHFVETFCHILEVGYWDKVDK